MSRRAGDYCVTPWPATARFSPERTRSAWAVVDPVLMKHHRTLPYKRGSWGAKEAPVLIAADGCWYNPRFADVTSD